MPFAIPDYGRTRLPLATAIPFAGVSLATLDWREPCGADMLAISEADDEGQERFLQLFEALSGTAREAVFALHAADYAGVVKAMRDNFVPAETVSAVLPGPGTTVAGVADFGRRSLPLSAPTPIGGTVYEAIPYRVPSGGDMFRLAKQSDVGHRRLLALAVNLAELDLDLFLSLRARDYNAVLREMAGFFTPAQPTSKA